jgi:hypothetical protein
MKTCARCEKEKKSDRGLYCTSCGRNGAGRKDIIAIMREQIARFEGQPEMKGTA